MAFDRAAYKQELRDRFEAEQRLRLERRIDRLTAQAEQAAAQEALQADPDAWKARLEHQGLDGFSVVWPGCGADPTLALPRRTYGFSIGAEGWFFTPEGGERQFVASPVVNIGDAGGKTRLAVKGRSWKTVEIPVVRGDVRHYETCIAAARNAGLELGPQVTIPGSLHIQHASTPKLLIQALFGVAPDGSLGHDPTVRAKVRG